MVIGGEPSEEAVGEMVLAYLDSPEFAEALDRMSRATENTDLGELIEKLEKDRAKLAELGDAFISTDDDTPNMDRAEYKRLSDKLRQRIATNEKRLSSVASVPHVEQAGRGDRLRKAWPRMTFDEKRDVLTSVLAFVDVLPAMKPVNRWHPERLVPEWRY